MGRGASSRRRLFGIGDLIGVAALVGIIGGLYLFDRWESGQSSNYVRTEQEDLGTPASSEPARQWSKSEFDSYIANRTKAQVRDEFGPPDSVDDYDDSWTYWSIPVYDAEAGVKVHTTIIRFAGLAGSSDFAVGARYN